MKQPYDAEEVIEGNYVINEMQIYRKHEQISNCIVNDNISINSLQNYFSRTGWEFLCQIMREKRANLKWLCEICSEQIGKGNRIVCDVCLTWYHMPCLNITYNGTWVCDKCSYWSSWFGRQTAFDFWHCNCINFKNVVLILQIVCKFFLSSVLYVTIYQILVIMKYKSVLHVIIIYL